MHISRMSVAVTPLKQPIPSTSPSKPSRRSMQTSLYRLPNPLPPLPVRKGVRGRRPKSETIALLKAVAAAAAAQNAGGPQDGDVKVMSTPQLAPRPHKKRGPKPGSKVRRHDLSSRQELWFRRLSFGLCPIIQLITIQ